MDYQTCRFCGEGSYHASTSMVRYGIRHWAHWRCYIRRRGITGLKRHQLEAAPYFALKDAGLVDDVMVILGKAPAKRDRAA